MVPGTYGTYYEPFVGGGALLFALRPKRAVVNDSNTDLVMCYRCFQDEAAFQSLVDELDRLQASHGEEQYLEVRSWDREPWFARSPPHLRAARLVYLNKTCFNGLWRVNREGHFNVPSGRKAMPVLYDPGNFESLRRYFASSEVEVRNMDFEEAVRDAKPGDFAYFDPPYDGELVFRSYSSSGFGPEEQVRLRDCALSLSGRGVKVMLSNADTPRVRELYRDFLIREVDVRRSISCKGDGRGDAAEVVITSYDPS